jgi:hypothetical protein
VDSDHLDTLYACADAAEMWTALKTKLSEKIYLVGDVSRERGRALYKLRICKMREGQSLESHLETLEQLERNFVREGGSLGSEHSRKIKLLDSLSNEYKGAAELLRRRILAYSYEHLKSALKQLMEGKRESEAVRAATKERRPVCGYCRKKGHEESICRFRIKDEEEFIVELEEVDPSKTCGMCGEIGHIGLKCPKLEQTPKVKGESEVPKPKKDLSKLRCYNCLENGHYAKGCPKPFRKIKSCF